MFHSLSQALKVHAYLIRAGNPEACPEDNNGVPERHRYGSYGHGDRQEQEEQPR